MRRAAKRDRSEADIVAALEAIGVVCYRISAEGLPDLLTWHQGVWGPIEIKSPGGKLTEAQLETRRATPFAVVDTVEQALALFNVKA